MTFSTVYFFGDSLSDQDRMHDLSAATAVVTIPVENAGYGEAFSNGPVHAEVLAGLLGAESENYAVGGAKAIGTQTVEQYLTLRLDGQISGLDIFRSDADPTALATDINLGGQVRAFVGDVIGGGAPPDDSAAAFLIGINDYSEFRPTSPETALAEATALVQGVVGNTIGAAAAAVQRGVDTIILYTMPNFRFFPLSTLQTPELLALGDQLIAAHNDGLARGAAGLEAMGANVETVQLDRISAEIMVDPETFGLDAALFRAPLLLGTGGNPTLIETPAGDVEAVFEPNPLVAGADPDRVAFIDFAHPGASVHATWGAFGAASLTSNTIFAQPGNDRIAGSVGADLILAGAGNDMVSAMAGADVVLGGLGNDRIGGQGGDDILSGGAGNDLLLGGCGADVLVGGGGDDRANGGHGADLLVAGGGFDLLFGGRGADAFLLAETPSSPAGVMCGGAGKDALYLVVDDATRAAVEAEWVAGAIRQSLDAVGLKTVSVEKLVFLDPDSDWTDAIATPALADQASLWGFL